jgi:hypothetical protein
MKRHTALNLTPATRKKGAQRSKLEPAQQDSITVDDLASRYLKSEADQSHIKGEFAIREVNASVELDGLRVYFNMSGLSVALLACSVATVIANMILLVRIVLV